MSFARVSGSEAEAPYSSVVVSGAGSGQVNDAAGGGNDGGNAGHFYSSLQKIWGDFGRAEHNLDPSRVEYIHKRSIFGLDTATNR